MDWSKAKTILIGAFIIANIFLIFNIERDLFDNNNAALTLKEETVQSILNILEEKNIKVKAQVPRRILEMPVLHVEYETYDDEKVMNLLRKDHEKTYKEDLDEKKARYEGENFLKRNGLMGNDVLYWDTQYNQGKYTVTFKEKYKGSFLENSHMKLVVSQEGLESFERKWLKPMGFGESKKEIIPATKALLKLMTELEGSEEVVVEDISLGYWFEPFTNWKNIKSGTAVPAWRFLLNDGQTKFIVAYESD